MGSLFLLGAWISVGRAHRGRLQKHCCFCIEECTSLSSPTLHLPPFPNPPASCVSTWSLLRYRLCSSHHMQPKKEAGSLSLALLSPLRETLGTQRIVLQLSFPEYFSFFFPLPPSPAFLPEQRPRGVFYPFSALWWWQVSGARWQLGLGLLSLQSGQRHTMRLAAGLLLLEDGALWFWAEVWLGVSAPLGLSYLRYLWARGEVRQCVWGVKGIFHYHSIRQHFLVLCLLLTSSQWPVCSVQGITPLT